MAPPGAPTTPSSATPLFISVVIVASSVVIASSVLLVIVLVMLLRRRTAHESTLARTSPAREHVPKLVITDTSLLPASSVVVENGDDLDKVIASFKPMRQEPTESEEPHTAESSPHRKRKQKSDPDAKPDHPESIVFPIPNSNNVYANQESEGDEDKNPLPETSAVSLSLEDNDSFKPPGIWWYDYHGSELSFASSSSGGSDALPVPSDSIADGSLVIIDAGTSLSVDREILEYCWGLSDENMPSARSALCDVSKSDVDRTLIRVLPEAVANLKPLKGSGSLDQKILEYCWQLTDCGSLENIQEELNEGAVTLKYTSAARSVSDASVHDLHDILHHDSGQIVVRCSKSRLAYARYSKTP